MTSIFDTSQGLMRRYARGNGYVPIPGIAIGEFAILFSAKGLHRSTAYRSKTRVFGACDDLVADLNAIEPHYIHATDENSSAVERVEEKMWRAWRDTTKKIAHERLVVLLTDLKDTADAVGEVGIGERLTLPTVAPLTDLRFSYKAGCSSCPCSPGFVMGGLVRLDYVPQDIYIARASELAEVKA